MARHRASLDVVKKRKSLAVPGLEHLSRGSPGRFYTDRVYLITSQKLVTQSLCVLCHIFVTMETSSGLVVRVPGYSSEMYCASCEVRTEFIYVM
jgi:hypothetical protein